MSKNKCYKKQKNHKKSQKNYMNARQIFLRFLENLKVSSLFRDSEGCGMMAFNKNVLPLALARDIARNSLPWGGTPRQLKHGELKMKIDLVILVMKQFQPAEVSWLTKQKLKLPNF